MLHNSIIFLVDILKWKYRNSAEISRRGRKWRSHGHDQQEEESTPTLTWQKQKILVKDLDFGGPVRKANFGLLQQQKIHLS